MGMVSARGGGQGTDCVPYRGNQRGIQLSLPPMRASGVGGAGAAGESELTEDMQTPETWEDKKFLE